MPGTTTRAVAPRPFGDLCHGRTVVALDDGQLLDRFADRRDEAAFAALVARHGPMVLATARAVLRHEQDAEDAFQATFLTLARKARSVRGGASLAAWLHRVAYRSAVGAGVAGRRRGRCELAAARLREPARPTGPDLAAVVQAEVDRLPAAYRVAVVLCLLEGRTYAEAAADLGCTEAAVRNRLARARRRLKASFDPDALLTPAPAVAGALVRSTTTLALGRAGASAAVLALARSAAWGRWLGPVKLAATLGAAAGLVALGLTAAGSFRSDLAAASPRFDPPPSPTAPAAPQDDEATIRGRVLDPAGQPVAGAQVSLSPRGDESGTARSARTTADGRYALPWPGAVRAAVVARRVAVQVVATAPGWGLGWAEVGDARTEVDIPLSPEGPPIEGRILNQAGQPVGGVKVITRRVFAPRHHAPTESAAAALDRLLADPEGRIVWADFEAVDAGLMAITNGDGRFTLRGVGPDRVVRFDLTGPTIATTEVAALTRPGPVPPLIHLTPSGWADYPLQPSRFERTVEPTRLVTGVVRDAVSGQPLVGWRVTGSFQEDLPYRFAETTARTDAQGQYHLSGLPPVKVYSVRFSPPGDQPYLTGTSVLAAPPGLEPVVVDRSFHKGVTVHGRVTDQATGQPVRGSVQVLLLPGTRIPADFPEMIGSAQATRFVGADGRYAVVAPPGQCLVTFRADPLDRYKLGQGADQLTGYDPATRRVWTSHIPVGGGRAVVGPILIAADEYNLLVPLTIDPDATSATLDLPVAAEGTVELTVLDPAGIPLGGSDIQEVESGKPGATRRHEAATVTLGGFAPGRSRRVVIRHRERRLAATLLVAAAAGPTQSVRLAPWGAVRGRVVGADGVPRATTRFGPEAVFANQPTRELTDLVPVGTDFGVLQTDPAGRFHLVGLVPGMRYGAAISESGGFLDGDLFTDLTVEPGEVKNLGDVRAVKPTY